MDSADVKTLLEYLSEIKALLMEIRDLIAEGKE